MAFNDVLLSGGAMGSGVFSAARKIPAASNDVSIQCFWNSVTPGGAVGVLFVQASNQDVANEGLITEWATLREPNPKVVNGITGNWMFSFGGPIGYLWVRVGYASIGGGGALSVIINGF